VLEEALDRLDKKQELADSKRPMTNDLSEDDIGQRRKLLAAIEMQFCSYGKPL